MNAADGTLQRTEQASLLQRSPATLRAATTTGVHVWVCVDRSILIMCVRGHRYSYIPSYAQRHGVFATNITFPGVAASWYTTSSAIRQVCTAQDREDDSCSFSVFLVRFLFSFLWFLFMPSRDGVRLIA